MGAPREGKKAWASDPLPSQILRAAAERARSSAYTALIATKAQSEAGGQQEATATLPRAELPQRPASTGRSAGAAVRRAKEVRAATPDVVSTGGTQPSRAQDAISPAASFGTGTLAAGPAGGRSVLGSEAEQRYIEAIQTLKDSIEREQYTVRMLQATRATAYSHKSEMEEFFLKCVDEARKELMRKKHIMLNRDKSDREKVLEAMLHNEDILVCLYEKLFPHRTGIARSLGAGGGPAEVIAVNVDGVVECPGWIFESVPQDMCPLIAYPFAYAVMIASAVLMIVGWMATVCTDDSKPAARICSCVFRAALAGYWFSNLGASIFAAFVVQTLHFHIGEGPV
eukprot:s1702_g1.t3